MYAIMSGKYVNIWNFQKRVTKISAREVDVLLIDKETIFNEEALFDLRN